MHVVEVSIILEASQRANQCLIEIAMTAKKVSKKNIDKLREFLKSQNGILHTQPSNQFNRNNRTKPRTGK
jgi:hypothetical protein